MVNYAEEADFVVQQKPKRYRSATEIAERKAAKAAARSEEDWHTYAREICFRQLGMMERSTQQLMDALLRNLVPQDIAKQTIAKFEEAGLVSDERYAQMFVRSKFSEKTISRRGLTQELKRRGIAGDIASEALDQISSDDEAEAAKEFAARKIRSMSRLEDEVIRRRLYGALTRRGFSSSQVNDAVRFAFASRAAESD